MAGCDHRLRRDGVCADCGDCLHEVILNHQCVYCGSTELAVTVKPAGAAPIPPERLLRRRGQK